MYAYILYLYMWFTSTHRHTHIKYSHHFFCFSSNEIKWVNIDTVQNIIIQKVDTKNNKQAAKIARDAKNAMKIFFDAHNNISITWFNNFVASAEQNDWSHIENASFALGCISLERIKRNYLIPICLFFIFVSIVSHFKQWTSLLSTWHLWTTASNKNSYEGN